MLRRSVVTWFLPLFPAFAAFVGCGTETSEFEPPPDESSSGEPSGSSGPGLSSGQNGSGSSSGTLGPGCGNAFLELDEECDDGNLTSGDGCSATCKVEDGYTCEREGAKCAAICGDAKILDNETCDDGNTVDDDGCSAGCQIQPGFKCEGAGQACVPTVCGDGVTEGSEQCDDGPNDRPYDGCYRCVKEPNCTNDGCAAVCGDGLLYPGEACDDGNLRSGDGCSSSCELEQGFACENRTEDLPVELVLPVLYRDFRSPWNATADGTRVYDDEPMNSTGHPDFERFVGYGAYADLVQSTLGVDRKPVFNQTSAAASPCVLANPLDSRCGVRQQLSGQTEFDEWYHDSVRGSLVQGVLRLPRSGDSYVFDSNLAPYAPFSFYPLDGDSADTDGDGWGIESGRVCRNPFNSPDAQGRTIVPIECTGVNPSTGTGTDGQLHNFLFTTELRFWFTFQDPGNDTDGPTLSFRGDDDVWIFVNGRRVIDLGGLHSPMDASVQLTRAKATELGMTDGNVYEISLFHAERHSNASNFKFTLRGFLRTRTYCETQCGDGFKTPDETCDDGQLTGGYNKCAPGCVWGPRCGDGEIQYEFGEQCDDANFTLEDGCLPDCTLGDSIN